VRGQAIGLYAPNGTKAGFLYANGQLIPINAPGTLSNYYYGTTSAAINAAGQIAGIFYDQSQVQHLFRYTNGVFETIGDPEANAVGVTPMGIGLSGQIAGSFSDTHNSARARIYLSKWHLHNG
jgi:probable HAF family extracellular repeat protein